MWGVVGAANIINALCHSDEIADIGRILREQGETIRSEGEVDAHYKNSAENEAPASGRIEIADGGEYDLFVKYGLGEDGDKNEQRGESHVQQRCQQFE